MTLQRTKKRTVARGSARGERRESRPIAVLGYVPELERPDGALQVLLALGANVVGADIWSDADDVVAQCGGSPRALVLDIPERPDWGTSAIARLKKSTQLETAPALAVVSLARLGQLDPQAGFDDFVLFPIVPAEFYARILHAEWKKSAFATPDRFKLGRLMVDRESYQATLDSTPVRLTRREFELLAYMTAQPGKMLSRRELLTHVWGANYEGGPRTVDIHVRRLRAKLGAALPLVTYRGAGYRVDVGARTAVDVVALEGRA